MIPTPVEDRRPPITPQLALRVAILGGVALTIFAVIFLRLWFLQVLSGNKYLAQANDNRVRDITIQAPRGDVVDRNGTVLVDNRVGNAIQIQPDKLPARGPERTALYRRLREVLHLRPRRIRKDITEQRRALPYANVTIKSDASQAQLAFILERQNLFPGIVPEQVYLRRYPHHDLAAQLFGTVGQVSPKELKLNRFRGVHQGTVVGQSGIEWSYDRYLRGEEGATRVQVDALGRQKGPPLRTRQPVQGKQLKLSLDLDLQKAAQDAIKQVGGGKPGGFVAMDPHSGEVLAAGSVPSFDPNIFSKPVKPSTLRKLQSTANGAPLYNRAIAGLYPTGSTFKVITSVAALQTGTITPGSVIDDSGSVKIGNIVFKNAGGAANGAVALRQALQVSSDVFFYTMGARLNGESGDPLQRYARKLGIGRRTGIDIPGEFKGLLPTPQWRDRLFKERKTDRPWTIGDNVNLAVGQGDLQATPLQMAVAYATIINSGRVPTPHLAAEVTDTRGIVEKIDAPSRRKVAIKPEWRDTIMNGLHDAA
ncbi:MAG: penicillin-binding protein 2, partial [Solirubrobacteraceae bacterium]